MEQAKDVVSRINKQVLELLGRHRELKSRHSELESQNVELNKTIEKLKTEIDQQKEQIVKLKISKSLTEKKDSTEVKAKVDELLREIDKCVGLLNH
jgi:predicted  nucleic acid-binding Zn-ribbon protein